MGTFSVFPMPAPAETAKIPGICAFQVRNRQARLLQARHRGLPDGGGRKPTPDGAEDRENREICVGMAASAQQKWRKSRAPGKFERAGHPHLPTAATIPAVDRGQIHVLKQMEGQVGRCLA